MVRVLIFLLILIAGLIFGPIIAGNQGFVSITLADYEIEMSITVFAILFILLISIILFVFYLIRKVTHIGEASGEWLNNRTIRKIERTQSLAQTKMLEGDFQKAEKLLIHSAKTIKNPTLSYLQATDAALHNGELERAATLLQQAKKSRTNKDQFAFDIMQVRLFMAQKKYKEAEFYLDQLIEQKAKHPEVLRLAEKNCLLSGNVSKHLTLLPLFKKAKLYSEEKYEQVKEQLYLTMIDEKSQLSSIELLSWWQSQPRAIRHNLAYQNHFLTRLIDLGDSQTAFKSLYARLKRSFDPELVKLIPQLKLEEPGQLNKLMDRLDQQMPSLSITEQAVLNRCHAQLAVNTNDWYAASDAIKLTIQQDAQLADYQLQDRINEKIKNIPILEDKTEISENNSSAK